MRLNLNKIVVFILASCLSISSALAANSQISQMLLVQDELSTKAYITLSQTPSFKAFLLQGPDRAVIDIDAAELGPSFKLPNANGVVLAVRQGKTPTGIRLVMDLAQNSSLKYSLDNSTDSPRIAIELNHSKSLATKNSPASEATKANDPIASMLQSETVSEPAVVNTEIVKPEIIKPDIVQPEVVKQSAPSVQVPTRVSKSSVPGQSNVGYALMDDEIVQIDIDSSGPKPQTTVKKGATKPISSGSSTPYSKLAPNNSSSVATKPSKKSKTINDVLGNSARQLIIAIDAGHGGNDPGALGKGGTKEKDITLRIAKELAAVVNNDPGMKAVLIRDNDIFVPLQERYMKARRLQADLFVSIHADAALNNEANGSSIYVLSTKGASSQAARWLADKENAADLVGGVTLDNKDKNLSAVLLDLSQSATMRMSEDSADIVLKSLKDLGKTHKKQVEHANFVVLRSPDVPSMLVETGFITNMQEERNLNNAEYRQKLAFAISQGIRNFFIEQPLPGTYYAKKQSAPGAGISASSGIIP